MSIDNLSLSTFFFFFFFLKLKQKQEYGIRYQEKNLPIIWDWVDIKIMSMPKHLLTSSMSTVSSIGNLATMQQHRKVNCIQNKT